MGKQRIWNDPVWDALTPIYGHPFSRVPAWVTALGVIAEMPHSHVSVYLVICAKSDNQTSICYTPITDLAKLAGVTRSSVPSIVRALKERGVILVRRFGNRQARKVVIDAPEWIAKLGFLGRFRRKRPTAFKRGTLTAFPTDSNGQDLASHLSAAVASKPVTGKPTDVSPVKPTDISPVKPTDFQNSLPDWVTDGVTYELEEDFGDGV